MLQLLHRSSNTNPNPNPNPNLVDNHDPNLNSPGNHSPKHCTNPTEPNPNPPVCIVSDVLMLFTQDIANKLGLPRVAVWLQSAASFAVNLHVPALIRDGYIPITGLPLVSFFCLCIIRIRAYPEWLGIGNGLA